MKLNPELCLSAILFFSVCNKAIPEGNNRPEGIIFGGAAQESILQPVDKDNTAGKSPSIVHDEIDWPDFLSRHDMIWEKFPAEFDDGGFLGNGLLGVTIYREGENRLRFEMGRADVTEHRRNNNRLPIGGLVLKTEGKILNGTMRLDLWNAELRGELKTEKGHIRFRSLIHTKEMVLLTDMETTGRESNASYSWEAAPCLDSVCSIRFPEDPANPPSRMEELEGIPVCVQDRFAGGQFATAWTELILRHKRRIILSIADTFPGKTAIKQVIKTIKSIKETEFEALLQSHRNWWHNFYPQSFVSIPDQKLESFYWIQWYKMASASRPGPLITDLLGPWFRTTGWPRIYSDMNVQSLYMPVYTANRMVLGESLTGHFDTWWNNYFLNAKELFGLEDCAYLPCSIDNVGRRGDGNPPQSEKTRRLWAIPGNLTWCLHNYYMHYRYTMDHSLVLDQNKHSFYPLLRANINLFLNLLERGEDGKLHLPERYSPEYFMTGKDSNYDLALLRWGCQTLLELNRRYKLQDTYASRWTETLDNLVPFPVDENGLSIAAGVPLTKSHRHWSHLLMYHPLHISDALHSDNRQLLEKSISHWLSVDSGKEIYGWSHAAASSLYSTLGNGDKALYHIQEHLSDKRFVRANTMYLEKDPVLECSIVLNRSLQDMLLQSWGKQINIFPALPSVWKDAVFHDLRAEGAFLVSAERKEGKTKWVRIKSMAGEPCRIKPGIEGDLRTKGRNSISLVGNGVYDLNLKAGEEVVLYSGETVPKLSVRPSTSDPAERNQWGVKAK
jgi:hypothetical protein